jgi:hypothetical protein
MRKFQALALLAAAALSVSGCHEWQDRLRVTNLGAEEVLVELDWWEYDSCGCHVHRHLTSYTLPAGDSALTRHGWVQDLTVLVTRVSDGSLVFSGSFDGSDFSADHGSIEIDVFP